MEFPLCNLCAHFEGGLNETGVPRCAAFPKGIPAEIMQGLEPHFNPIAGETVVFKPRKGVDKQMVDDWIEAAEQTRPFMGATPSEPV